jgi:hypothetical protein
MSSGEAGGPTATEVGAETGHESEKVFARNVADKLIANKGESIRSRLRSNSSLKASELVGGEKALYARATLSIGLKKDNDDFDYGSGVDVKFFNANDADDTLSIDPGGSEGPFSISKITSEETAADGSLVYICKTPGGEMKRVPVDTLVAAHAKKNADAIESSFLPDPDQSALAAWYVKEDGSDCPVDPATVSAIDSVDFIEAQAVAIDLDVFISQQIDDLQNEIAQIQAIPREQQDTHRLDQLQTLLGHCQKAAFMEGSGGTFYKENLLREEIRSQRAPEGTRGRDTVNQIDELLTSMHAKGGVSETAEDDLIDHLKMNMPKPPEGQEQEDTRFKALAERVLNGEGLAVLQESDVASLKGTNELIFGSEAMSNKIVDNLLGNPDVDQATKDKLAKLKDGGKLVGMGLFAILLTLPATAIYATFEGLGMMGKNR